MSQLFKSIVLKYKLAVSLLVIANSKSIVAHMVRNKHTRHVCVYVHTDKQTSRKHTPREDKIQEPFFISIPSWYCTTLINHCIPHIAVIADQRSSPSLSALLSASSLQRGYGNLGTLRWTPPVRLRSPLSRRSCLPVPSLSLDGSTGESEYFRPISLR